MIITLCGSARFEPVWHEVNKQLGLAGHICFSLMTFPSVEGNKSWYTKEQKEVLDLMHLKKITHSDAVVMLNVGDYLGESSLRELAWARYIDKHVYWLQTSKLIIAKDSYLAAILASRQQEPIIVAIERCHSS